MKTIIKIFQGLIAQKYWGELTFIFNNGKIVGIKKHETIKVDIDMNEDLCV